MGTDSWHLTDEERDALRKAYPTTAMFAAVESIKASAYRAGQADAWARGHGTTCDGIHDRTFSLDGCEQHNPYRLGDDRG